jgi:hypothetical protein
MFLRHEGYLGAIGAFALGDEHTGGSQSDTDDDACKTDDTGFVPPASAPVDIVCCACVVSTSCVFDFSLTTLTYLYSHSFSCT